MRATANRLTGCLVLGLPLFLASVAQAGTETWALRIAQLACTQSGPASTTPSARELLNAARDAMSAGRYDDAAAMIDQAERIGGPVDPLVAKFQYTPDKARQELAQLRAAGVDGSAAGRGRSRYSAPTGPAPTGAPAADPRAQGMAMLRSARQALAKGQADQAALIVADAKRLNVKFGPTEDSPTKVEALIAQHQRFATQRPAANDPNVQREYAHFLLNQAEQLLMYGDAESAQQLATRAKALPVRYGSFERTPDQLLQKIAGARPTAAEAPQTLQLDRLPPTLAAGTGSADEARRLLAEARLELERNNLDGAQQLAQRAKDMNVQWQPGETQPWQVLFEISSRMRRRSDYSVAQAGFDAMQAGGTNAAPGAVQRGLYLPENDPSRVMPAANVQPAPADPSTRPNDGNVGQGQRLYEQGLVAMDNQDMAGAMELFRRAWAFQGELDPETRQQLKDKLTYLGAAAAQPGNPGEQPSPIEEINARQQIVQQQLFREITTEQRLAEQERMSNPKGALNRLQKLRGRITAADVDPASKKQFLTFVDRSILELERFIDQNRGEIELMERNEEIAASIERDQQEMLQSQDLLAKMVQDFNTLMDERRFAEAEVVAKQAREIAPQNPVVITMVEKSRFANSIMADIAINERKDAAFIDAMNEVGDSSVPHVGSPIVFGDAREWELISKKRQRWLKRENQRMSPEELEIERSLSKKVQVNFREVPLQDALQTLCALADVPVFMDPQGLAIEAVTTDQPITIELSKEISLKSALDLILAPMRLGYVVESDVLKITSESARNAQVYTEVYNVADLVIPIPNFVPGYNVGLPAAIREAHATLGHLSSSALSSSMPLVVAANDLNGVAPAGSVLAQTDSFGKLSSMRSRPSQYNGMGPGGMGGAALADFDTLMELITSTIANDTWEENGGNGAIEPFPTNLSLVISQTQDVHEQIVDLLDQLRRLQDLQVSIEVRFITLSDDFFERIGIDFDFDIDDNTGLSTRTPLFPDDIGPSTVVGLDPLGNPTNDLDLQFNQGSFGSAIPQFGGFDAATAANFGFAILSDIEVFFLLEAAQGDSRSNILQAPRVTLFDGQQASVADQSQRPFVTSIIPVVGDFAAAHQPVITVLSEGTSLSVQAVVSHDRRFVRLTLVPFFSQIGEVDTFTFVGSTTSDSGTNVIDSDGNPTGENDNVEESTEGSTVQLPTFSFTTVSTTVNVPDGGTVLLGGIKRLSEGRNEAGVPMLGKLPYINRLFKNVGIGRTTQSLMLMVTPHILIQAEEEAKILGGAIE